MFIFHKTFLFHHFFFSFRSAFFLFCADYRAPLKAENPGLSVGEIAKALGKKWASTLPDVKRKYTEMGEIEKEKYNKEMEKYRNSLNVKNEPVSKRQKLEAGKTQNDSSSDNSDSESDSD